MHMQCTLNGGGGEAINKPIRYGTSLQRNILTCVHTLIATGDTHLFQYIHHIINICDNSRTFMHANKYTFLNQKCHRVTL